MVDISIIIVTWNTKRVAMQCLESLCQPCSRSSEIIVVDNASTDGTVEQIRQRFPQVRIVCNAVNLGFAKANNIGIRLAQGKYVFLINSDVVVPEGCLDQLFAYIDQQPTIGMLGPLMRMPDGATGASCMRFPSLGNWFCRALALDSVLGRWGLYGGFLMTDFRYNQIADVDVLTGWFWVVRRSALATVGLLDENFFMYGEDIEWSKRFHDHGWRVVFYPDAQATHYCAASSGLAPTRFYVEMNRANLQYWANGHEGRFSRFGFWSATLLHEIMRILGYGAVYLLYLGRNPEAGFRVQRSSACLLWLMGLGTTNYDQVTVENFNS